MLSWRRVSPREALQQSFRIGESYIVEPSLNRVTGPRGISRLEPKVMMVLVCLAEHAGLMVPRNRLLHAAWPDTAVTDDVLTRAISELRHMESSRRTSVENVRALGNLEWIGTGTGFFSTRETPRGKELLFIRMDGTSHVLWSQGNPGAAIPSPDGTHLAIAEWTRQSNVWMVTRF